MLKKGAKTNTITGVNNMAKLPSLTDIINSVSESEYNQAMSTRNTRRAVFDDWNKFKVAKGGGKGLTMVSGMDPTADAFNAKMAKNAARKIRY